MFDRRVVTVALGGSAADDAVLLLLDAVLGVAHHLHQ